MTYSTWVKLASSSEEVEFNDLDAPNVWRYLEYDEDTKTFTASVQDGFTPADADDLDLTEIIIYGEVVHDITGTVIASTQALGWDFSVDVVIPIEDRCVTTTLSINMAEMEINEEGGYLPESTTEGDYLAKTI